MSTVTQTSVSRADNTFTASRAEPISSQALASAAGVTMADRVLVVGRNVIDQVVGLVQSGCHTVSTLCADLPYSRKEPLDVLWLSGISNVHERLNSALANTVIPRLIVIDVNGGSSEARFLPIIRQLRDKGFVRFTAHRTVLGVALVAAQAAWFQQGN